MFCFWNAGAPRQRRIRWGCVLLRTSMASGFGGWEGHGLSKLPRWLWAGCVQTLGCWIGMTESCCAVWSFQLVWYIAVISWCRLILWVMRLNPKSHCPLWPRQVMDSRRRRERWKPWSRGRERGSLCRGEMVTTFRGRTWAVSPNSNMVALCFRQQGLIQHTEKTLPT